MKRKKAKLVQVQCKYCKAIGAIKYGKSSGQRYKCASCGRTFRLAEKIPKKQRYGIPVILNMLKNRNIPEIKDQETNSRFTELTKEFIDESAEYKLVETTITEENRLNVRKPGNTLTLLYIDKKEKVINAVKLDEKYTVGCSVTQDGNISITLSK